MKCNRGSERVIRALLVFAIVVPVLTPGAWAQSQYKTLHRFKGGDGRFPQAALIFDQAGNLYGTTNRGGSFPVVCSLGCGTVFKLTPNSDGSWKETVIYQFKNGKDGATPFAGLIFDTAGNLYGTTELGGNLNGCGVGCGVVFKLTPKADGSWKETVLHQFRSGKDGAEPMAGVIFDQAGNLYGTTGGGGAHEGGTVFKLTPNANGSWKETVIHQFKGDKDGAQPVGGVTFDQAGNLYGTTELGGTGLGGVVFKLTPKADGSWTESVLHSFRGGDDGLKPDAGLTFDQTGNLYGTTRYGGRPGAGVVFKLTPKSDGTWREQLLHRFTGSKDGGNPYAVVIFDQAGNLYGTTQLGGTQHSSCSFGCGVVFKLTPNSKGGWKTAILHRFLDHPGAEPVAGLIFDAAGNLYGTTLGDQRTTFGSVFEITP